MRPFTGSEPPRLFIDTWGWLVLADAHPANSDAEAARRRYGRHGAIVTTDFVLDETITRLFARGFFSQAQLYCGRIFEAEETGGIVVERITAERFRRAWRLRLRYRDKPRISFTDLTSLAVMQEMGIRHVLTADTHFAQAGLGFRQLP